MKDSKFSTPYLNSNLAIISGIIDNDICECRYTAIGKIILFDIGYGKAILEYNKKYKIGVIPTKLRPPHDLEFAVRGNDRTYIIYISAGAMYITPTQNNLPSDVPPYIFVNICYLLK